MNDRIGTSAKFLYRKIRQCPLNPKQLLRCDWLSLWMVVLRLGAADKFPQTSFFFHMHFFLSLFCNRNIDGRIAIFKTFVLRAKQIPKLPLVEDVWIF